MARTPVQIEEAMIASIGNIDPGIDARKGPHRGAFIQPQANVLSQTEQVLDDCALRYSLRYVMARNPAIMDLYAANHGLAKGQGSPSRTQLVFYTFSVPSQGGYVFIPAGSVVTTRDATVSFQTTEDLTVDASAFSLYYNNITRRYEFSVWAASIGIGPEFEISAGRLTTMQSTIEGIVGVSQPLPTGPSRQIESNLQLGQRQQSKFVGTAIGTSAGIESLVRDFDPSNILDVGVVYSTEYDLFRRPLRNPGFDVYIVGSVMETTTDTFRSSGGETTFLLTKQPVSSISTCLVNGVAVVATLLRDTQPATQGSVRANDRLLLQAPTDSGSTVQVSYTYNKLLSDISSYVTQANQRYWRCDILIRAANPVALRIVVDIQAMSTSDPQSAISSAQLAANTYINLNRLGTLYTPTALVQAINGTTVGVSNVRIKMFQRIDQLGTLDVDVVETNRTEYAFLSPTDLTINVFL